MPFGLSRSGGSPCQNRITGHPPNRTRSVHRDRTFTGISASGRKIFGSPPDTGVLIMFGRLALARLQSLSRHRWEVVQSLDYESCHRHAAFTVRNVSLG
ncbi:hypothetical protein DN402_11980 [Streptomyces sp. SW4]|nr:hypothetical protein DN402_11980 [Streptomyces sp. SW4]